MFWWFTLILSKPLVIIAVSGTNYECKNNKYDTQIGLLITLWTLNSRLIFHICKWDTIYHMLVLVNQCTISIYCDRYRFYIHVYVLCWFHTLCQNGSQPTYSGLTYLPWQHFHLYHHPGFQLKHGWANAGKCAWNYACLGNSVNGAMNAALK